MIRQDFFNAMPGPGPTLSTLELRTPKRGSMRVAKHNSGSEPGIYPTRVRQAHFEEKVFLLSNQILGAPMSTPLQVSYLIKRGAGLPIRTVSCVTTHPIWSLIPYTQYTYTSTYILTSSGACNAMHPTISNKVEPMSGHRRHGHTKDCNMIVYISLTRDSLKPEKKVILSISLIPKVSPIEHVFQILA